ncbi:MAG: hypothetical protein H0T85_11235 [Geodermatophilaceae bacterium]|nr:hypothetical protein [Geodermatophilaceae bacterium]
MTAVASAPSGPTHRRTPARGLQLGPGWPLTCMLVLYPLWWALGLGVLIVFIVAVPMLAHLAKHRPVKVPPAFGLWLLFLAWVLASTLMLGYNPPGTLPEVASDRIVSVVYNIAGYAAATIILLFVGNLTEQQLPRARIVRQLGLLFIFIVVGGIVGTFFASFEFTSPLEFLLPNSIAQNTFVQSLVHPTAAQLQEVLGYTAPRPSAPFGYTNTWGNCLSLLLGWFVIGWLVEGSKGRRIAGVLVLVAAAVPVVYSLNRGLWIALGLCAAYAAVRLAMKGRFGAIMVMAAAAAAAVVVFLVSPLNGIVQARLDNPQSNGIRAFTTEVTLEASAASPILGFGSTRAAVGSSQSIAVGQSDDCQRCGNPTIGSNGQLWLLLIAQGFVGAALYIAFYVRSAWVYRRDRSSVGVASWLAAVLPLFYMFIYNALVMPLLISMIAIGLLWRNHQDRRRADVVAVGASGPW